ncbi:uncharacterized protein LOC122664942 [Telopea speciosissima]|uniref:uncharacterized protein LOC122664942 n=1 Tax=Telopea speciosissima TaxID=54955 RepID=UPI001CC7C868|nr:uncharacterized protein LOC122664942 [Telopea speciosissima]
MDGNTSTHLLISQDEAEKGSDVRSTETEQQPKPKEPWRGECVKSIVYAGLDAIVTCFALISSISAGHLSSVDVLVLGFANLVADGISMGFGDFVSSRAERDMAAKERMVTEWEITNQHGHPRQQKDELIQRYQALGMDFHDAVTVVKVFSKYKDILVDEKMTAEKRMLPPDQAEKPWKNGLITFVAFLVFGSFPLLSFIILLPFTRNESLKFWGACALSALALALLGLAKAKIAGQNYALSIAGTLFNGAIAAASAYLIGWALRNLAGLQD